MPLELSPLPPADLHHYEDLVVAAFADSLHSVFYPGGFSPEAKAHTIAAETSLWETMHADVAAKGPGDAVSLHYMQVVDTDVRDNNGRDNNQINGHAGEDNCHAGNGESEHSSGIIGVSKWMIYPRQRSEAELLAEEAEAHSSSRPSPPGINSECVHAFHAALQKTKRQIFGGKPYIILHVLVTHPDHHRRGVGAMHLKWGEELADRLGLPLYLEASQMGKPLYERWGYREVMKIPFDARDFGSHQEMPHVAMVRPANGGKEWKMAGEA